MKKGTRNVLIGASVVSVAAFLYMRAKGGADDSANTGEGQLGGTDDLEPQGFAGLGIDPNSAYNEGPTTIIERYFYESPLDPSTPEQPQDKGAGTTPSPDATNQSFFESVGGLPGLGLGLLSAIPSPLAKAGERVGESATDALKRLFKRGEDVGEATGEKFAKTAGEEFSERFVKEGAADVTEDAFEALTKRTLKVGTFEVGEVAAEAGAKAAVKSGAKFAGKTALKAIPLIGIPAGVLYDVNFQGKGWTEAIVANVVGDIVGGVGGAVGAFGGPVGVFAGAVGGQIGGEYAVYGISDKFFGGSASGEEGLNRAPIVSYTSVDDDDMSIDTSLMSLPMSSANKVYDLAGYNMSAYNNTNSSISSSNVNKSSGSSALSTNAVTQVKNASKGTQIYYTDKGAFSSLAAANLAGATMSVAPNALQSAISGGSSSGGSSSKSSSSSSSSKSSSSSSAAKATVQYSAPIGPTKSGGTLPSTSTSTAKPSSSSSKSQNVVSKVISKIKSIFKRK